jgi:acyl-coenzyme A thioesterase PaaI-like protein
VGSLMETAAILETLWRRDPIVRPRTINLTVDYLRPAGLEDVVVTVEVLRSGRRVSTVLARAWQGAPRRLVSVAKVHLMLSG